MVSSPALWVPHCHIVYSCGPCYYDGAQTAERLLCVQAVADPAEVIDLTLEPDSDSDNEPINLCSSSDDDAPGPAGRGADAGPRSGPRGENGAAGTGVVLVFLGG